MADASPRKEGFAVAFGEWPRSEVPSGLTVFLARSNFPAARGATIFIAPLYVLFSFLENNYFIYIIFHILSTYS
jgi:hypothetical protein